MFALDIDGKLYMWGLETGELPKCLNNGELSGKIIKKIITNTSSNTILFKDTDYNMYVQYGNSSIYPLRLYNDNKIDNAVFTNLFTAISDSSGKIYFTWARR